MYGVYHEDLTIIKFKLNLNTSDVHGTLCIYTRRIAADDNDNIVTIMS
jgi:hypothetical protein